MAHVSLWIPLDIAMEEGVDELVERFDEIAENLGGELVDDSETMDPFEWFEFDGLTSGQVLALAVEVLGPREGLTSETAPVDFDDEDGHQHVIVR